MFAYLLINFVLALIWCFLTETFTVTTFVIGNLLATGVLFLSRRLLGEPVFFRKLGVFVKLLVVFTREVLVANVQVAWWILRPRLRVQPAMIRLPIALETDAAITALAGMISLTPGTVTVDVAPDRKSLEVHCLNVPDIAATKAGIKEMFEKPLRELER
ncbi:MAG: Na(+)/H(+) antiporter subunit E [Verrucomicrobiae bacterium]|nr:Na(+)/H(+) antiporter subunit E [Verrucomicrobiae bacterium]